MVSNTENIQKLYTEIPNTWTVDGIRIDNYSQSNDHFSHGWREVVIPTITELQRLGDEFILVGDIITKEVIDFTTEEIEAYNKSLIPKEISRMKFEMQVLLTTGIEWDGIIAYIVGLSMSELYKKLLLIRLKRCVTLKREDNDLNTIAFMMGITQQQLDEIFINGNLLD